LPAIRRPVNRALTLFTRFGFAARGLLYLMIATLVIRSGRAENPSGALGYLADGGATMLVLAMAVGFLAYGSWRMGDALFNIERHPASAKGMRQRLAASGSGIVHLVLAWRAFVLAMGGRSHSTDSAEQGAAVAMTLPGGPTALLGAAAVLAGVGAWQLWKAATKRYMRHLEPHLADRQWVCWTGRIGYAARGLILLIVSYFMVLAGLDEQAGKAGDMKQALRWLDNPWDIVVAVGLGGFGLFSLIESRFRVLNEEPVEGLAK